MTRQKLLKLITLDITNTLMKVAGSPGRQYGIVGRLHGVNADETELTKLFIKFYKQYLKKYPNFGATVKMPAHKWWSLVVEDCFRCVDPTLKEEKLEAISDDMFVHYTKPEAWELLPGALEALKDLHSYDVKLGVISNWDHRLYQVLEVMNLQPYFDFIIPSYVVGMEKPERRIFELALKTAGCHANEACHLGDNLEKDLRGARLAGLDACLLITPDQSIPPGVDKDCVVDSLGHFVDYLRPFL